MCNKIYSAEYDKLEASILVQTIFTSSYPWAFYILSSSYILLFVPAKLFVPHIIKNLLLRDLQEVDNIEHTLRISPSKISSKLDQSSIEMI